MRVIQPRGYLKICVVMFLVALTCSFGITSVGATTRHQSSLRFTPHTGAIHADGMRSAKPRLVSTLSIKPNHDSGHGGFATPLPPRFSTPKVPVARSGAKAIKPPARSPNPNTSIDQSFAGQGNTGWQPSDSNATAGPSNVIETVNEQWAIYGRTGGQQYVSSFNTWFGQSGSLFDPKVEYDPWGGRFIMLVDTGSSVLISVARQSSAFGNYCNYTFTTVTGFADYPQLGVDNNGIYFGVNMYNSSYYNELFNANRSQMENCQTVNYWYWSNLIDASNNYAFTIVPAVGYSGASYEYLVNSRASGGCSLTLWLMSGSSLYKYNIGTLCYSPPPAAAQKGSSGTIETLDNRLFQASYINGQIDVALTGAYNWGSGNQSVVWWFKINNNATLNAQGGFGYNGYWYFFPGFVVQSNGNAIFVYNSSGAASYVNVWTMGLNSNNTYQANLALVWGQGYYGTSGTARWGDYQSAHLDPTNYNLAWVCGQYASGGNSYSTWLGQEGA